MKPVEIKMKISLAEREAALWREILRKKSCLDCLYYGNGLGCRLANDAEPPEEVKKVGCDSWEWDEIPF